MTADTTRKITVEELYKELAETRRDIARCKRAISAGMGSALVSALLKTNREIEKVIVAEFEKRGILA